MSEELVRCLTDALLSLDKDPSNRTIILTGSGGGFCSGSDLGGLARMSGAAREAFEDPSGRLALHSADPGRHFGVISSARRSGRSYFGVLSSIKCRV